MKHRGLQGLRWNPKKQMGNILIYWNVTYAEILILKLKEHSVKDFSLAAQQPLENSTVYCKQLYALFDVQFRFELKHQLFLQAMTSEK